MPISVSVETFVRLVAIRARFAVITKELTLVNAEMYVSCRARHRYEALQKDLEQTLEEYKVAIKAVTADGKSRQTETTHDLAGQCNSVNVRNK